MQSSHRLFSNCTPTAGIAPQMRHDQPFSSERFSHAISLRRSWSAELIPVPQCGDRRPVSPATPNEGAHYYGRHVNRTSAWCLVIDEMPEWDSSPPAAPHRGCPILAASFAARVGRDAARSAVVGFAGATVSRDVLGGWPTLRTTMTVQTRASPRNLANRPCFCEACVPKFLRRRREC